MATLGALLTFHPTYSLQNRLQENHLYITYTISTIFGTRVGYCLLKFNWKKILKPPTLDSYVLVIFISDPRKKDPLFCSSAISTLQGIENKRRLQTLSIDNAWSNKHFYYTMRLFSNPLFSTWLVAISSSAFRLG